MKTFSDPNKIDILCDNYVANCTNATEDIYKTDEKVEEKQSAWTKIKSKVRETWGKIKPVISGLTTFFTTVTALLKTVNKFIAQCKNVKEAFA